MILKNIGQLTSYNPDSGEVETTSNTSLTIDGDRIAENSNGEAIDCGGSLVTPGFVDPHTHSVFLDSREEEFALRLSGVSYEEIAAQGGGINASINGVRNASKEELIKRVSKRMDRFLKQGTTTVECKTGYGLDTKSELKSLQVIHEVNESHEIDIIPTFLGAHAFPPEFADEHEGYVDLLCAEMIPAVAEQGIAVFCDVFCENGYFNVDQSRRIFKTAKNHGLTPRLHADEFEDSGAAELAAEVGAVSADHLMAVSTAGLEKMAEYGVTATLLPGTTFFLGKDTYAPARKLLEKGIDVALATDFNPGSCQIQSMPFIISLACIHLGMTVEEAFASATYYSAKTLNLEGEVGSIAIGRKADLIIWDVEMLMNIPYNVTDMSIKMVIKNGKAIDL
ncbi:MAG: imidazolonepropionase [Candidatus Marinimicrobia bacterium]|jgi:imidazolonepropionase|nr:imidazolonepropionase [Candidatus Neomarinimicrobiota bacterium]|tara:strand:- start:251 stop:1432 length:1182 start_codon:yes stop_codon:yes gene_type:complete